MICSEMGIERSREMGIERERNESEKKRDTKRKRESAYCM